MHQHSISLVFAMLCSLVAGQEFPGYNCPSSCALPSCKCASKASPVQNPPQFILVTFDDGVNSQIFPTALGLFSNRKNPNGCQPGGTFFAQATYTDPYLLTQWYAAGHEVGDHSFTHGIPVTASNPSPFAGNKTEILGTLNWMHQYGGIPAGKIRGVRFPYRNYTAQSLTDVRSWGFTYDSSMSVGVGGDTSIWPYTLDYGVVSECTDRTNLPQLCGKPLSIKGLWEIPMYQTSSPQGVHLMDVYNDYGLTSAQTTSTLLTNFQQHYSGSRAPFGVYTHPNWMTAAVNPASGAANLKAVSDFLDKAMANPDVWMVTGSQLIEYMKNPVPASQLGNQPYMKCGYKPAANICNGASSSQGVQSCPGLNTLFNVSFSTVPPFSNPTLFAPCRLATTVHLLPQQYKTQLLHHLQQPVVQCQLHVT